MANITLQTIESLPLVEEVNENTSLVGWDGTQTVRVPNVVTFNPEDQAAGLVNVDEHGVLQPQGEGGGSNGTDVLVVHLNGSYADGYTYDSDWDTLVDRFKNGLETVVLFGYNGKYYENRGVITHAPMDANTQDIKELHIVCPVIGAVYYCIFKPDGTVIRDTKLYQIQTIE